MRQINCSKSLGRHELHVETAAGVALKGRAPVFSRMGFGAWQAICSAVGSLRKSRTRRQKVVPFVSPWVKSKAPGPATAKLDIP